MKNLKLEILNNEDIKRINETSLDVLEKVGLMVDDAETRAFLKTQGCIVDEGSKNVRFPRDIITEFISKAPSSFTLHSRDGQHDVRMVSDGSVVNYMNLGMGTRVCHYVSKNQFDTRDATLKDIENIAKLEDGLQNVDLLTQPVSALDLMTSNVARTLYEVRAIISNTSKPYLTDPLPEYVADYFAMMKAVYSGDEEETRKKPFLMNGSCSSSPLQLDRKFCLLSKYSGDYGIPFMSMTMAMAGSTSPIDLAGTVVIHNCEALAGIALTQMFNPGTPTFYGSCTTNFDFMTNTAPFGSPENTLISSCSAQMAQFYRIPSVNDGSISDSKYPGFQSAQEAMMNGLIPCLTGCSNVFGVGLIELGMTYSMEQAVLVNDMIPLIRRIAEGVAVDTETLSYEDIAQQGPGGNFIPLPRTMNGMFSQTKPEFSDRNMIDEWVKAGRPEAIDQAHDRVVDILTNHQINPIEKDALAEIDNIVKAADKRLQ